MKYQHKYKNKTKRNFIFKSFNDIQFHEDKKKKENIASCLDSKKASNGLTPIRSKNKKIIMFSQDEFDKALQRGKSPFFISDKINFRNEFKCMKLNKDIKTKHLGLCDYYMKKNRNENDITEEVENDHSRTPRFKIL